MADTSLSGGRVVRKLDAVIIQQGGRDVIVSDNGTQDTPNAILGWANETLTARTPLFRSGSQAAFARHARAM